MGKKCDAKCASFTSLRSFFRFLFLIFCCYFCLCFILLLVSVLVISRLIFCSFPSISNSLYYMLLLVLYVTSTFTCALCELLSFKKIIPLTLAVLDKLAPLQSAYQRKGQRISTWSRICQQFWHQSKETICFAFQARKLVSLPRIFDPY